MHRPAVPVAALLLLCLPLLAGCGSLLGQRYTDFRAYYNTFYNAQRDFEREEREILRADPPVDRTQFLPLFVRPEETRGGRQGLDNAIRKAADVLRDHPNSRWIDDALLLIGKAYHYQGNFSAAAQKFREVLQLDAGRLDDEAYLWLGRALTETEDYGAAAAALRDGIERDGVRPRGAAAMRIALAEVDLRQGDLEAAAEALRAGLEELDDRVLAARAAYLLGQVNDALGQYDAAADAYALALRQRPTPELVYAAELQRALALSRSGHAEPAVALLGRLARDDKYFQQRAQVDLVRARVLAADGRGEEARDLLRRLLYDRASGIRIDAVRGQLHYRLGEVYRDALNDYPRAAAHFDTAATALRGTIPPRQARVTPEAITDIESVSDAFRSYAQVQTRIAEMDSLLYLASLDDAAFAEAVEAIREQRRREALARQREVRRIAEQQGFGATPGALPTRQGQAEQATAGEAGFLNYRDPVRVQENRVAFQTRWGDRPYVPNWRRGAAASAAQSVRDELDDDVVGVSTGPEMDAIRGDAAVLVDISAVPRAPEAHLAMRTERAAARYELGNVLLLALNEPETAVAWYERVVREDPDAPVAVRAYFALAEAHLAMGDEARAETFYRQLVDRFPDDPLARAARERLALPVESPASDEQRLAAEAAYEDAFDAWQRGRHAEALRRMLDVDAEYAGSHTAARARLAAGAIYSQWAAADTLALLAPNPDLLLYADAHPDTLLASLDSLILDAVDGIDQPPAEAAPEPLAATEDGEPAPAVPVEEASIEEAPIEEAADEIAYEPVPEPAVSDTLAVTPDDLERIDEPDAAEPVPVWLEDLYASIEEDFPDTPYAQRAYQLRQAIIAYQQALAPVEDEPTHAEIADAAPDTTALPELPETRERQRGTDPEPNRRRAMAQNPGDVPLPVPIIDEATLRGTEPLDPSAGGYTWVVLRTSRPFEAQNRMIAFHNRGYRTALYTEVSDAGEHVLVLIGRFGSEAEAEVARDALPIGVDEGSLEIRPLAELSPLQSITDLLGDEQPNE